MLQNTVNVIGPGLIPHLRAGDKPGMMMPIVLTFDRKRQAGAVITVQDRAIIAWEQGRFRVKLAAEVIPFAAVTEIKRGTRQSEDPTKPLDTIEFTAAKAWDLSAPQTTGARRAALHHLGDLLEG